MYKPKHASTLAYQLTMDNATRLAHMCGGLVVEEIDAHDNDKRQPGINVPTLDGPQRLSLGDYLVQDSLGRYKVMSKGEFEEEFEEG